MSASETRQRYGTLEITLHWLMLIVIAAVYACIELRELYPKGSGIREALKTWHFMLGLLVLALVAVRLGVRLGATVPPIVPQPVAWQAMLAKLVHVALYALMIAMPIGGWLILSASGKPIPFFGLQLPALIAENKDLSRSIKEIHETIGKAGYFLIGLHAAAALFHHYVVRDNTLLRMLPRR